MPRYTAPCWWLPFAEADSEFDVAAVQVSAVHYGRVAYAERDSLDVDSGTYLAIESVEVIKIRQAYKCTE